MSSESPNQPVVKPEPTEVTENGEKDVLLPDVSPRKKPRKQLLYVIIEIIEIEFYLTLV